MFIFVSKNKSKIYMRINNVKCFFIIDQQDGVFLMNDPILHIYIFINML